MPWATQREVQQEGVDDTLYEWLQGGLDNSERSPSQGELLLYAPQGLGALHQLLLLVGLQGHVNDICQAAVAQDTRDAQEDLILHSMHALSWEGEDRQDKMSISFKASAECTVCSWVNWFSIACSQAPYLDQCGHWVHFVQVLQDAFHQVSNRHTNGPGGVALQLDDIIGSVAHTEKKAKKPACFSKN